MATFSKMSPVGSLLKDRIQFSWLELNKKKRNFGFLETFTSDLKLQYQFLRNRKMLVQITGPMDFSCDVKCCGFLSTDWVFSVKRTFLILMLMRLYSLSFSPVSFGLFETLALWTEPAFVALIINSVLPGDVSRCCYFGFGGVVLLLLLL